jgi:hypothetical protein
MNTIQNIDMTIDWNLSKPKLVRQLTLGKISSLFTQEVTRPVLECQVSADIDWEAYPYCLSFPEKQGVTRPVLEYQVSADIDWEAYPYCLSFPQQQAKL